MLGRGITNAQQLTDYCRELFGLRYHGTYASDRLPTLTKERPYAIVNNKTVASGGEHWVGIVLSEDGAYIAFDSYGRDIKSLIPSLYKHTGGYIRETDNDVDETAEQQDCGSRCAAWLRLFDEYGEDVAMMI